MTFDSSLKFDKQIDSVVKASFFQLRLLAKVKPFLNRSDLEKAIHAFISSRLDYCNALYVGVSQSSLNCLQLVQNAAARLLTNTRKREHITPILYSLHWLPVSFRVDFKILLFVFKALNGLAPLYVTEMLAFHQPNRVLRSTNTILLEVPRSRYKHWGDRAFSVAGPRLWNKLPPDMRTITDLGLFNDWCDEWGGAESRGNGARPVELMIMSDTCTTHRSRVPRRSSGRIKGGATTVEDERGPGLDHERRWQQPGSNTLVQ